MKKEENVDEERENFSSKKGPLDQIRGVLNKEKGEQMTKNISLFGSFFF